TEAEWREKLAPAQFDVLRRHGTERSGASPLEDEDGEGIYTCAACGAPLFSSKAKFEAGTGWPSFFERIEAGRGGETTDSSSFMPRTEVHCGRCGGHLGHALPDGPEPTGLRYCMNGVARRFDPAESKPGKCCRVARRPNGIDSAGRTPSLPTATLPRAREPP